MKPKPLFGVMLSQRHTEAALAVVQMDRLQCLPSIGRIETENYEPTRRSSVEFEVETARERVHDFLVAEGSYAGRHPDDVHITVQNLSEVLDCSEATARRRIDFLMEKGVLYLDTDGSKNYYSVSEEFAAHRQDNVLSESEVVDTTKKLFAALEEE